MKDLKDLGILKDKFGFGYIGEDFVRPDDDLFILKLASKLEGIVLSQDCYQEYWDCYPEYEDVRWRILRPTFVRDSMELPDGPYGIEGPTLEHFLRK